ncbi:MAG: transposase [Chloroflexota bacterium]|nr:transposase [Chloroflexota bacterium]
MLESTTPALTPQSTPQATLVALGLKVHQLDLFRPIRERVLIQQKTVRYTPIDKLYDAWIAILAGAQGLVEVNTRLRSDPALQAAFGRTACAEQSVIQDTLDACDATTVQQMEQALTTIFQQHSQASRHDYAQAIQVLDIDITGLPCGPKAAFATKGSFAKQRNRRGRQLGRVLATCYHELVVEHLVPGTDQLVKALRPLVEAAEAVLELDAARRARTLIRVDAGGGSLEDLNWLLARDYGVLAKEYAGTRARKLAATVAEWIEDPRVPGRQIGWVPGAAAEYVRPVVRIAVRCRKKNGQGGIGVLVGSADPALVGVAGAVLAADAPPPLAQLLGYVYRYDARGGGIETAHKEDKQGLGIGKRNKKRFAAQQVLGQLGRLAHNVVIWARRWLAAVAPRVGQLGVKRLVRDVFHVNGLVERDPSGRICRIVLNQAHCYAHRLLVALQVLVGPAHVAVSLGET